MDKLGPLVQTLLYGYCYVAIMVSSLRWLRVAQREHYIPGSVGDFGIRWWTIHWANAALLLVFLAMAVLALLHHPYWGAGALTFLSALPAGLTLRGRTSKLAWTGRMKRLFVVVGLIYGLAAGLAVLGGSVGFFLFVVSGAVAPAVVDLALALTSPIERLLSERYVREAAERLRRISPKVVAITGSFGKTTTKRYSEHFLAGWREVFATPASYNNRLGIARAINESMPHSTDVFIAEVGTYGRGEISDIVKWLKPDVSALLAVGPVHLERFGSLEAIALAKSEIFEGASVLVANLDDEYVRTLPALAGYLRTNEGAPHDPASDRAKAPQGSASSIPRVVWFSVKDRSATSYVELKEQALPQREGGRQATADQAVLWVDGEQVGSFDPRQHVPVNVAAAAAVAFACGMKPQEIGRRLATLPGVEHRRSVEVTDSGVVVIDDTYNSNPVGARIALETLRSLGQPEQEQTPTEGRAQRKVVVTPGMVELGPLQYQENEALARTICEMGFELVIVGFTNRKALLEGARKAGVEPVVVDTREEAVEWVRQNLASGDAVLYENDLPDHYP
jgi:UDP-N-acetylmuramoyl-tripeptide--D-alanyl-D-alanine ligase